MPATSGGVITILRKYWANASRSPRLAPGREHGARARQAGVATKADPTQDIAHGARGFFENTAGYRPRGPRGFRKNLASSPGQLAKTQSPRAPRSLFCIRSFDTIWNPNWTKISCIKQSFLDFFQWKQSTGPRSTWVPVRYRY